MNTASLVTLLHIYLALAVTRGTSIRSERASIRKLALEMTMALVNRLTLAYATSSEVATAATCGATLQVLGTQRPSR